MRIKLFVLDSILSKSTTVSKLLIASTLSGSFKISNTITEFEFAVLMPDLIFLWIDVSAKFFSPAGCTRLLTVLTNLSQTIGLLTVYDKFW